MPKSFLVRSSGEVVGKSYAGVLSEWIERGQGSGLVSHRFPSARMDETLIGGHVSITGGLLNAFDNAIAIGANFIQIFTHSPRVWKSSVVSDEDSARFRRELANGSSGVRGIVTHASYLINLASADPELLGKSVRLLVDNVSSASKLGARGVVLHLGSHKGAGLESCLGRIKSSLLAALDSAAEPCRIFLENTAGAGGSIGTSFEELARVIEALDGDYRLGICLDTQHLFASGVSYKTMAEADAVVDRLSKTVGIERLGCVHFNDSKVPAGSLKDRHQNLGEGLIGDAALGNLVSHPSLLGIPLILETPGGGSGPRTLDVEIARELLRSGIERRAKSV
ncbi:MAG: deoxyribonuclease IV [Candidatus Marsarchaeota archaeon]|nr:deoxyribonuclease IV [Candidatus Marsarchaeota archaeon]